MGGYRRKQLFDFDPTKSDSDDGDYGDEPAPERSRKRSRKPTKGSPRKRAKRTRDGYGGSDIEPDSDEISEEEDSFAGDSEDEEPVETNPRTGRGVRSAAKKVVKYEESDEEEEIAATDSDRDPIQISPAKNRRSAREASKKPSLIVKLSGVPWDRMAEGRSTRSRTGSRTLKREPTPQASGAAGARRSSRLSHDDQQPLVSLTDSGKHEQVTRAGTATPEPEGSRRPTRGSKGLKKPPSAIMEASQEDSVGQSQRAEGDEYLSQLVEAAAGGETQISRTSPVEGREDEIRMEYEDDEEEVVVQESQPDPEDDEDDEPVSKGGRTLRAPRKASTPPASQPSRTRRSLRNSRKSQAEQTSDFEPDAEGEVDADEELSESDDHLKPRGGRSSAEASSQGGRRSGRLARSKAASNRSRSRRSPEEEELDVDEIADEAADLEEDNRRNRRPRKRASQPAPEITFEPSLRKRGNRPDYRILRPELLMPVEDDDAPAAATVTPQRNRRTGGGGHTYRSLFSTHGPFGGAGGPPPVLGGPDGAGATGGVDSDSSDDEAGGRGQSGMGGTVGMTPTSAMPKPFAPAAQAHNADPIQGPGGGPPGLGKVKDKKALADADPLGVDPNVNFDGVGGLDNHINQLKEMVTLPLLYPEVFQRFHVTPPRGVLFHGPPGTGKTLLARALASDVSSHGRKVTFYMRKGADALSKWVGEAEKQLRLLFEEARKNQPSIIFFDEIDGLAPVRSSKQEQIHASIVATLLALMDGMDGRGQVIVIGATNRPDSVDPALRRPGRFDREFYFPLPDVMGRRKIIDIHTKGWDPPLKDQFKDELAGLTRGYGGADLRALCTEAALNAVQGTFPQIYSSNQKLIIDPNQIKVLAKDFMISVNKIVPSSERAAASGAAALKKEVEPLLREPLQQICERIDKAIPRKRKATALEEAMYDDREDELGFEKEVMQREFEASRIFRPRLLIKGVAGMGQHYLGAALLSKFEGLHVQSFDLPTLMKDSTRSPEAAVVQLFEEVKRHKPSVIFIPDVNIWYETIPDPARKTFVGLLKSLPPTDPVLLLATMEIHPEEGAAGKPDPRMLKDMFGYSMSNQFELQRPKEMARREFFDSVINMIRKNPSELPDAGARKKRKLAELPVAPAPKEPEGPSKEDLKALKKKDRHTLNLLKMHVQGVMDQIKLKYKKFRMGVIDDATIAYLYDEQNPNMLTSDLSEEQKQQQQLFRPYEISHDEKGVPGLREVATDKFYYNLEIVTIEKRLSNGYYKRPKDFLADIKRLAKDAKTSGDQERTIKANEMLANVEVDMTQLETSYPVLAAEWEAVYQREQQRERERVEKQQQAQRRGEEVPKIVPNVPPANVSKTTTDTSGPVMLGQQVPGRDLFPTNAPPATGGPSSQSIPWSTTQTNGSCPSHQTNGSSVPSRPQEDSDMQNSQWNTQPDVAAHQDQTQTQGDNTQMTAPSVPAGSQADQYHQNSGSTTGSSNKVSDRSSGASGHTHASNGVIRNQPDFSMYGPRGGSQEAATQEPSVESRHSSQLSQSSQQMAPPRPNHRTSSLSAILNVEGEEEDDNLQSRSNQYIIDEDKLQDFHRGLVNTSSGLSLEQLEQVYSAMMEVVWEQRGNWNRNQVWWSCQQVFNDTIEDIEACQRILDPSQEDP